MTKKTSSNSLNIFWFRRDLRLHDNRGLSEALSAGRPVLGIFIFDPHILDRLDKPKDLRVQFIHERLTAMDQELKQHGSSLLVLHQRPEDGFEELFNQYTVEGVFTNQDYEPYPQSRDEKISKLCSARNIMFRTFKDHVIFEQSEVVKDSGEPYGVYTPYKKKWLAALTKKDFAETPSQGLLGNFAKLSSPPPPSLRSLGFEANRSFEFPKPLFNREILKHYAERRDFPHLDATSRLGLHLRFGTLSVRQCVAQAIKEKSSVWLSELIWREFFIQILFHHPRVVKESYRLEYDKIQWSRNKEDFQRWCEGRTGYPMVDAGMRELVQTGYMHNRVRMVVASFLCKHLLLDWRWGESFFAKHLLDFELASNNGNWQWAAGTGCDAAPYFRVFNPEIQLKKFDPDLTYIKKWIPEYGTSHYCQPMVDHREARERALRVYDAALKKK